MAAHELGSLRREILGFTHPEEPYREGTPGEGVVHTAWALQGSV